MSQVFDSATILRFEANGEQAFCSVRPCIIDRIALNIVSGTAKYDLPSSCISIRRVTYKGWKVYPLPHRDLRQSYLSGTQQSRPYWYIFNNIGQTQIQFFPVPSETIAAITTNLYGSEIGNRVIVEYFRIPDQVSFIIPSWFRRQLLKCYINKKCFSIDTKSHANKASEYWNDKFNLLMNVYSELLDDLNNKPRNLVATDSAQRPYGFTPPAPILPVDRYGISVDEPSW